MPAIVAAPVPAVKPGWKTSEAWLTMLVIVLGGLFASGLVAETSQLGKLISFELSVLGVLGYQYQRGQIKTAHMVAHVEMARAANDNASRAAA